MIAPAMDRYTHTVLEDEAEALNRLPALPEAESVAAQAAGPDGKQNALSD